MKIRRKVLSAQLKAFIRNFACTVFVAISFLILNTPSFAFKAQSKTNEQLFQEFKNKITKGENPVFDLPMGDLRKGDLWFLAEINSGSDLKHEFKTSTGQLLLDRKICPRPITGKKGMVRKFPASYGITPGLFNVDGDPLDLLVLGTEDFYFRMLKSGSPEPRSVRVIGLVKMEECGNVPCKSDSEWEKDWKVLGVDIQDVSLNSVKTPWDLKKSKVEEISDFFSSYKAQVKGVSPTRVAGFTDRKDALKYISSFKPVDKKARSEEVTSCNNLYETVLSKKDSLLKNNKPGKDEKFVKCMARVYFPGFMKDKDTFDFYLKFSAYQLLVNYYGDKKAKLSNALKRMEKRKKKRKRHFRFVGFDSPGPGTGLPIFDWVKTQDRSVGCPKNTKAQHFEARPLIDHTYKDWF